MKKYLIILNLIICHIVYAQKTLDIPEIKIPHKLLKELINIYKAEGDTEYLPQKIIVLSLNNKNNTKIQNGIYSFKTRNNPHAFERLIFINNNTFYICKKYDIDYTLECFLHFIRKEKIADTIQIQYLNTISEFLDKQIKQFSEIGDYWE